MSGHQLVDASRALSPSPSPARALRVLTLCSGVECFGLALEQAGMHVVAACEADPAAAAVIRHHYPDRLIYDDVRTLNAQQLHADGILRRRGTKWHGIDVIVAGWPCQDLSVAGRRAGLAGARSGLFYDIARIVAEVSPRWFVGENVPGLLSSVCPCPGDGRCQHTGRATRECTGTMHSTPRGVCGRGCIAEHGAAMGAVLGTMAELGLGYAWRVLDAQHFGVAQRRRRVFLVGHSGDRRAPVAVLLEPESGNGHPAPRQPTRTTTPTRVVVSTLQAGGHRVDAESAAGGQLVVQPAALRGRDGGAMLEVGEPGAPYHALRAGDGGSSRAALIVTHDVTPCLTARYAKGMDSDVTDTKVVTHALTAEGHDASEDGTGRGTPLVPVTAATLTAGASRTGTSPAGRRREDDENLVVQIADAAASQPGTEDALALPVTRTPITGELAPRLSTGGGCATVGVETFRKSTRAHAAADAETWVADTASNTLNTFDVGEARTTDLVVEPATSVRRLTPRECERLQGLPDDWTRWKRLPDGRIVEQSDSARYKQIGNGGAVPVMAWIGARIVGWENRGSRRYR